MKLVISKRKKEGERKYKREKEEMKSFFGWINEKRWFISFVGDSLARCEALNFSNDLGSLNPSTRHCSLI
jgi:hypothetical protein